MAGRLTKTKAKLVNGKCFNYARDVKLNGRLYDDNPTTEQKKNYAYHIGIFASFWVGHLEFVNKDKKIPEELKRRTKRADIDVVVVDE